LPRYRDEDAGDYTGSGEQRLCAQGDWCRGYRIEDGKRLPALTPRPFCEPCTRLIAKNLDEIPERFAQLHAELGNKGQAAERVSGTREAPVPVRLDIDALMREIITVLASWDERVRQTAGLTFPGTGATRRRRDGTAVTGYVETLALRLSALLTLQAEPMRRDIPLGEVRPGDTGVVHVSAEYASVNRELSGVDAGLEILTLHRRCRAKLAETRRRDHLDVPCPGCDALGLERDDGSDHAAECTQCGRQLTPDQYEMWTRQLAAYERARAVAVAAGVIPAREPRDLQPGSNLT
jgi:hypothetical protein